MKKKNRENDKKSKLCRYEWSRGGLQMAEKETRIYFLIYKKKDDSKIYLRDSSMEKQYGTSDNDNYQ